MNAFINIPFTNFKGNFKILNPKKGKLIRDMSD